MCDKNSLDTITQEGQPETPAKREGRGMVNHWYIPSRQSTRGHRKSDWSLLYITRHSSKLLYTFP